MKKGKIFCITLSALILIFGITACDTGSSTGSETKKPGTPTTPETPTTPGTETTLPVTERTLTPLTVNNLVGTWTYPEESSYSYDYPGTGIDTEKTIIVKLHFFADSTFVEERIFIFTNVEDPDEKYYYYAYDKGTITIDQNNLTYTNTHYIFFNDTEYTDFNSAPWDERSNEKISIKPVFIYNGGLYTHVLTRETEGTGLLGTWKSVQQNPGSASFEYFLTQVSFNENNEYTYRYVSNNTGFFEDFDTISNSTYNFISENIFTYSDTTNNWTGTYEIFLAGDLLAMTGGYPEYCYTKETP